MIKLKDNFAKAVILRRLERLKFNDFGDFKYLGEDVFELRIMLSAGYRVYLKKCSSDIILLLVGGNKSTQEKDISLAKRMAKEA